MKEFVLATTNKGKLEEFNEMGKKIGIKFTTIDMPEIEENGTTFEENSLIKAKAISKITNMPVVADDSGLCIECLPDELGLHTARFLNHLPMKERCLELIKKVDEKNTTRDAYFVCVITLIYPDGKYYHFRGETYGSISKTYSGENGHGYDPVFYSNDIQKTFGMASITEKDSVSHRGRAFKKFEEFFYDKL
jgi:hypothetical protein